MSSIAEDLADALTTVSRPASYFVTGTEQMLAPELAVDGVGPVALPLLPIQAEQLITAAERAPYGRGSETLTDLGVRRTWQIGAGHVRIKGKHWPKTLQAIVARVADGLGVADPVEAELYKLLVYDQGSFFLPHRDTEKAAGMFATLILALPSVSAGGELIVRHKDREVRLDLRCEEASDVAFAAFYADCVHEVLPVTEGYRLALVYNLLRRGAGPLPEAPAYDDEQDMVAALLRQWAETPREPGDDVPDKLIYPLEHAYTPAELGFGSLKGADAAVAQVVVATGEQAGCDVHLALVSIEESGVAQYNGEYRRGRYHDDDDEFEIVEVSDRQATASHWRRPDGDASPLTELPINELEFSPPMSFDDLEPDEQHFQEATGNEGASFERSYSRAALILWPRDRLLAVINHGGLVATLPFLEAFADRWVASGDRSAWEQAHELSELMISSWPLHPWYRSRDNERTSTGRFLGQLVRLGDTARMEEFLPALFGRPGFDAADSADMADALTALPADRASALAKSLIEASAEKTPVACTELLMRLAAFDPVIATAAARTLVAALPGDPAHRLSQPYWLRGPGVEPAFIVGLFTALGRIDATLAAVSVDHVLEWPGSYDFDTVLMPAVRILLDTPETAGQAATQRLRVACLKHLQDRIALPLEPPGDWRRDDKLGCSCQDCTALAAFLRDAGQPVWAFAAPAARRGHVEDTIRSASPDVATATEKRGSPHRLICTKNQATYERRCLQRTGDLAEQERLRA